MNTIRCNLSLTVAFAGLVLFTAPLPSAAEGGCRRASAGHLLWVHTGEWEGQRLVLGDVGEGALALLDPADLSWSKVSHPGEGPLEFTKHGILPSVMPGVVVSALTRIVRLDGSLQPVKGYALAKAAAGAIEVILPAGVVSPDGSVVGVGVVLREVGESWQGVARLVLEPTLRMEPIRAIAGDANENNFYASLFNFGAVLNGRTYWLAMDSEAFVLEIEQSTSRRLELVPAAWRPVPKFPNGGFGMMRADFAASEKLDFPAGLYSQGKELFILYHGSDKSGTRWSVAAVDPTKPDSHRPLTLPTRSNWVTMVPGPEYWAILEQGPVLGPATQTTTSVLLAPSAWFSSAQSPLMGPGAEEACRSKP